MLSRELWAPSQLLAVERASGRQAAVVDDRSVGCSTTFVCDTSTHTFITQRAVC